MITNMLLESISRIINSIIFHRKKVSMAQSSSIHGICYVRGEKGRLSIGENVCIRSGFIGQNLVGYGKTYFSVFGEGYVRIGNNAGISNSIIVCRKEVIIDDYVNIGGGCRIYDSDFHSLDFKKRTSGNDNDVICKSIHIKYGAFIGCHCIILKGVTIGEKSIIGAGSVVTKDIPAGEIWAGNPARKIREIYDSKENDEEIRQS